MTKCVVSARLLILSIGMLATSRGVMYGETPLIESNSWALSVPTDPFTDASMIDLRDLNEAKSGESGFIKLSADRNDFVRGDGQPIRFWSVGTEVYRQEPEEMDRHCRWLAKRGVNLIRLHVTVCRSDKGAKITDLNEQVISGCHRMIKAAKQNGIYVIISPYYAHFDVPESWGIQGGKQRSVGLLFFNSKVQQAYKQWTREFYSRINPHTGLAIKEDPTVAMLQIQNEDSMLFWTTNAIVDSQWKTVSGLFTQWLNNKYGSAAMAWKAWGQRPNRAPDDDLENGRLGCLRIYDLTLDASTPGQSARLADTAEFLGKLQRDFYANMGRYLRDDVGCRQLLNATNWRTANDSRLKAIERYSYHALDFDAENEYVGSDFQHLGPNDGYRIDAGDYLVNESVLPKPFEMCTNWRQEEGHPFIATETAWKNPNRYQSEGPFLVAAYQSLNGVDAVCWFNCLTPTYQVDPLRPYWKVDGQMSIHKWNHCYPSMMAGFPANALLYRRGYLKQADPVVREVRSMKEIWNRKPNRIGDNETGGDQRNPPDLQFGWNANGDEINRVAFQIGPVVTKLGGDPGQSKQIDLTPFFDPQLGTIESATGELNWNYRKQVCTMDAPKAQGVTGFLAASGGQFEMGDVVIQSKNEYATINVVSLDDRPIAKSSKVLIQVVTVNRLSGWETKPATFTVGKGDGAYQVTGEQIVRIGKPPFRIANTEVTVTINNPQLNHVSFLDINGYIKNSKPVVGGKVELSADTIYAVMHHLAGKIEL